jgi:general secretion pathway protein B
MSFILDALKKSEMERQRQSVPGLMDTRLVQRRHRLPVWAVALGVLLAVNLLGLVFVLSRKSSNDTGPRPVAAARVAATPAPQQHFSPLDPAPQYAPEIPVAPAEQSPSEDAATATRAVAAHPVRKPDPTLTDEEASADNQEVLPSINEISLAGAQSLPELHLDVHVYATRPAERFVYINMRKYHEGGKLQEGPSVERIRRDGVVLNYQGLRFILPRQP